MTRHTDRTYDKSASSNADVEAVGAFTRRQPSPSRAARGTMLSDGVNLWWRDPDDVQTEHAIAVWLTNEGTPESAKVFQSFGVPDWWVPPVGQAAAFWTLRPVAVRRWHHVAKRLNNGGLVKGDGCGIHVAVASRATYGVGVKSYAKTEHGTTTGVEVFMDYTARMGFKRPAERKFLYSHNLPMMGQVDPLAYNPCATMTRSQDDPEAIKLLMRQSAWVRTICGAPTMRAIDAVGPGAEQPDKVAMSHPRDPERPFHGPLMALHAYQSEHPTLAGSDEHGWPDCEVGVRVDLMQSAAGLRLDYTADPKDVMGTADYSRMAFCMFGWAGVGSDQEAKALRYSLGLRDGLSGKAGTYHERQDPAVIQPVWDAQGAQHWPSDGLGGDIDWMRSGSSRVWRAASVAGSEPHVFRLFHFPHVDRQYRGEFSVGMKVPPLVSRKVAGANVVSSNLGAPTAAVRVTPSLPAPSSLATPAPMAGKDVAEPVRQTRPMREPEPEPDLSAQRAAETEISSPLDAFENDAGEVDFFEQDESEGT